MNEEDRVTLEDIADVRARVLSMRRRSLFTTELAGLALAIATGIAAYFAGFEHDFAVASFLGAAMLAFCGIPSTVHWWRHWERILRKLQFVENEVRAGTPVYGSQVQF